MPILIDNFSSRSYLTRTSDHHSVDLDYEYPFGLELKPGSEMHDRLRDIIRDRAYESRRAMSSRYESWSKIDELMSAFIPASEDEKKVKDNDVRRPISVVVPTAYANLQTLMTYYTSEFLRSPIFRFDGEGPEDIPKAILAQHVLERQLSRTKSALSLHTMGMDAYKYNLGCGYVTWIRDLVRSTDVIQPETALLSTAQIGITSENLRFEGNKINSIDAYDVFVDPNYPSYDLQSMEYFGWIDTKSYMQLLLDEETDPAIRFNARYLAEGVDGRSIFRLEDHTGRYKDETKAISSREQTSLYSKPVDVLTMLIEIIPRDFGLSEVNGPELWMFELSGDEVITLARPFGTSHGLKPAVILSPDADGHSVSSVSRLETVFGLNEGVNYMYNSRIANLRKSINNMLVVDPGIINYKDVIDTKAGMVARARRAVWGMGKISDGIESVPVLDITKTLVDDIFAWSQVAKDSMGARDIIQGVIPQRGERVSSTEANLAARGAMGWLAKDALIMWLQGYQDIAEICVANIKDEMSEPMFIKVIGELADQLESDYNINVTNSRVEVDPELFRDFAHEVIPIDNSSELSWRDPNSMLTFLQVISQRPEVAAQFDVFRIAKSVARALNIRDVETWTRQLPITAQTQSLEQVENGVDRGDLVPLNGTGA